MDGQRVGYVRVSSFDQKPDRQLDAVSVARTFIDQASGKDARRLELDRLLAFVRDGDTWLSTAWTGWRATWMTCGALCRT